MDVTKVTINGKDVNIFQKDGKSPAVGMMLAVCFVPSSAHASVTGFDRQLHAEILRDNLAKLGKIESLEIVTDEIKVKPNVANLKATLDAIVSAVAKNDTFRKAVEVENATFKNTRGEVEILNPKESAKRGRKATDPRATLLNAFA